MHHLPIQPITVQEFFDYCEQHTDEKLELINGQIVKKQCASRNHSRIMGNFFRQFFTHLTHPLYETLISPFYVQVKTTTHENWYLPDVLVDCISDNATEEETCAFAPILIVEIASASTRENDFSQKFNDYQNIPSLKEYVIAEQDTQCVYVFRQIQNWQAQIYQTGNIDFESVGCTISIDDIYDRVRFQS